MAASADADQIAEALQRLGIQPDTATQLAHHIATTGIAEVGGVRWTAERATANTWHITADYGFRVDHHTVTLLAQP